MTPKNQVTSGCAKRLDGGEKEHFGQCFMTGEILVTVVSLKIIYLCYIKLVDCCKLAGLLKKVWDFRLIIYRPPQYTNQVIS